MKAAGAAVVALLNRDPFSPTDCGPGVPACTAPPLFPIDPAPTAGR